PDILQIRLMQKFDRAVVEKSWLRPNRDETVVVLEHDASPVSSTCIDGLAGGNRVPSGAGISNDIEMTRNCRGIRHRSPAESQDRQEPEVVLEKNVRRSIAVEIVCKLRVPTRARISQILLTNDPRPRHLPERYQSVVILPEDIAERRTAIIEISY